MQDIPRRLTEALTGRYQIERELGAGGMATVYLAHDVRHDRKVALKVLRAELSAILGVERFLQEIKTTANLQHPHILPLHDSGEAAGSAFYVMPFVEGESLRDRLRREKQLPVDDAVRLAREVASALDYAHRHGTVHRDIKPENILLHEGRALVADFGIALAVSRSDDGTRITETGLSLGTPAYMSPEQAMGERGIGPRSDVWALGCVVYEMLTGEPPFTGPTAQAIIGKMMSADPEPVHSRRKTVPAHIDAAVQRALEKLPADRFASAAEFDEALQGRLPTLATSVQRGAALRSSGRFGPLVPGWFIAAGLVIGMGIGVVIGSVVARRPAADPGIGWFEIDAQPGTSILGHSIDLDPTGRQLVYIGRAENGASTLFRRDVDDPIAVPIAGTSGGDIGYPFVEPGGERVGFYQDRQLRTVSMAGGAARSIVPVSGSARGAAWTGDHRVVYSFGPGSGLWIVSAEGGDPRQLTDPDATAGEVDHRWPHVIPGDRWIAFTIWRGSASRSDVGVVSIDGGEVRLLVGGLAPRYVDPGYLVYGSVEGVLRAIRFDPRAGTVRGSPTTVLDSILVDSDGSIEYAVSWTGTLLYHNFFRQLTAVLIDRAGNERLLPTPPLAPPVGPRFSRTGSAFAVGDQGIADQPALWVYDLRLNTYAPLVDGDGFYPLWTPDGRDVIYSRNDGADVHVYVTSVDRSGAPEPLLEAAGQYRTQDLSPDGRYVLLRKNVGPRYELWVLDREAGDSGTSWLATDHLERSPTFAPNGRWVAYSSDESGRDEVYVRPFPGPGGRTQVSSEGGIEPAWNPRGGELFYRSGTQLLSVRVDLGDTFRVLGSPTVVLDGPYYAYGWQRQYDVHPDGQRFLMMKPSNENSRLNIVVNWAAGWQRRLERD